MYALKDLGQRVGIGLWCNVGGGEAVVCPHADEYQVGIWTFAEVPRFGIIWKRDKPVRYISRWWQRYPSPPPECSCSWARKRVRRVTYLHTWPRPDKMCLMCKTTGMPGPVDFPSNFDPLHIFRGKPAVFNSSALSNSKGEHRVLQLQNNLYSRARHQDHFE